MGIVQVGGGGGGWVQVGGMGSDGGWAQVGGGMWIQVGGGGMWVQLGGGGYVSSGFRWGVCGFRWYGV